MIEFEVEKYNKRGIKYLVKNEMIKRGRQRCYKVVFPDHDYEHFVGEESILKNAILLPRDYIIGKTFESIRGEKYIVLEFSHVLGKKSENRYYRIKFIESGIERIAIYENIIKGKIKFMHLDIIGRTFINKHGDKYEVIENVNETHYKIRFETGNELIIRNDYFLKNNIVNMKHTSIHGVGYLDGEPSHGFLYLRWKGMLDRCYSKKDKNYKWYGEKGVKVCDEWLSFKNYCSSVITLKGYNEELVKSGYLHLDKDIIDKDKKIYSPETCMWVDYKTNIGYRGKNVIKKE